MVSSRTLTALAGLAVSLLVSAAAWIYLDTVLLFLFLPFVPFLLGRGRRSEADARAVRRCPDCGFQTSDPNYEYCPRDGSRLRGDGLSE
ncbi:zinc ribbon domain-containing protein [Halopiger thermotolerans]